MPNESNHVVDGLTVVGTLKVQGAANDSDGVSLTADSTGRLVVGSSTPDTSAYSAADYGLIAWSYDIAAAVNSSILPTAGRLECVRLKLPTAASITNIVIGVGTAGATLTAGQCFAAIYQGGALIGSTADQSGSWNSTGVKVMALASGPFSVTAGDLIVAFYANGTTLPTLMRSSSAASIFNLSLGSSAYRFFNADTGRTTSMPATLGAAGLSGAVAYWAGVS